MCWAGCTWARVPHASRCQGDEDCWGLENSEWLVHFPQFSHSTVDGCLDSSSRVLETQGFMCDCICALLWGDGSIGSFGSAKETTVRWEQYPLELPLHQQSLWTVCSSSDVTQKRSRGPVWFHVLSVHRTLESRGRGAAE